MVIKEDGTKWACQSCLKGHRVSGCTHTDRELTLVPKKGRPVTQCHHCRLERKKRSSHVKCDCGEVEKPHHPKEKCIHLREAEERAKAGFHDEHHDEKDPAHLAAVAEEQGCCCHHGGKCTCSFLKKEPDSSQDCTPHGPAVPKPRLDTTRSDGSITVFANGHHKPVHRKNHAAHECGMPYKMPVPRTHPEHGVAAAARRSVDSLALKDNTPYNPCNFNFVAGLPLAADNQARSAQASPRGPNGLTNPRLSSLDFSTLAPVTTNNSIDTTVSDSMVFPPLDPMSGLADNQYDPWSVYPSSDSNFMPNNNPFGPWPTTFDNSGAAQPALTAASSGTQSEVDEVPTMDDLYNFSMPSIQESFDVETAGDTYNSNRHSLPPGFFGNTDFNLPTAPNDFQTPVGSVRGSDSGKSRNDQPLGYLDTWQSPTMPSMVNMAQRSAMTTSNPGRPQSQSVGQANAPGDLFLGQLFPEMDINNPLFGAGNSPTIMQSGKGYGTLPNVTPNSAAMDMSSGFARQDWSDGSMSVPNDDFPSPYSLGQNFPADDFEGQWSYN